MQQINLSCGESYIDSPTWIKSKNCLYSEQKADLSYMEMYATIMIIVTW